MRTIIVILSTLTMVASVAAASQYSITDIGLNGTSAYFADINNHNQVSFSVLSPGDASNLGLLYDSGNVTDLGGFGGTQTFAGRVNEFGAIAGYSFLPNGNSQAFVFKNGQLSSLGDIGIGSLGGAINNLGQIAGVANYPKGIQRAFIYYSPDNVVYLGTFGGDTSLASDINDAGQVVGTADLSDETNVAFEYENGVMKNLGTLGGAVSGASAINNAGIIVGSSFTSNRTIHAFIYDDSNGMRDIGPGYLASAADDINIHNVIVGEVERAPGDSHAFVYSASTGMRFLDDLIPPASDWSSLVEATSINDLGQIVGIGFIHGERHVFLATPTPEPSTAALLVIGCVVAFIVRRR